MLSYASYTDIGGRSYNEDFVDCRKADGEHMCIALADGLGGHGGGEIASKEAVSSILQGWRGIATPAALCDLVQEAHRKVVSLQTPSCKMKTTIVVLSIEPERAQWAHVGDSRLYHFIDGSLAFQTRDHSASQLAVLMGQIRADEIRFHEDRSRIFRALGQETGISVDAKEQKLLSGQHAFLLCTDGFWEYVYEEEMEGELRASTSPRDWLERMKRCLDGRVGKDSDNDNNTAAAIWLTRE